MTRYRLRAGLVEVELRSAFDVPAEGEPIPLRDPVAALALLRRIASGSIDVDPLRRLLAGTAPEARSSSLSDHEVLHLLAHRIAAGALRVWRCPVHVLTARDADAREEDVTPPPEAPREDVWIAIELVEEDGRPVAGEPYVLEAPDGARRTGKLDSDGYAEVQGIPTGTYLVSFPERDRTDFQRSVQAFAAPRWIPLVADEEAPERFEQATWLEIELVEEDGRPVAGEPYAVEMRDRSVRTGSLDDLGRALILDLPPGSYRVWFPDRDAADLRRG